MRLPPILILLGLISLSLAACRGDETVSAYGAANIEWRLIELDGQPFPSTANLRFPEPGRIAGSAPCNTYGAVMQAPYPWFDVQQVSVTRMACDALALERQFLQTLQEMSLSEVSGATLILSNTDGREMIFTAAE